MTYYNAQKYILASPDEVKGSQNGTNIKRIWNKLGNPQRNLKYIRLAGSNGKTVSAEMLMSVYRNTPYRIGALATTLRNDLRFNILLNGEPLSFDDMASYVEKIYKTVHEINKDAEVGEAPLVLTKQEILLCTALLAFRANECNFCIIESDHKHTDPTVFLPHPFLIAICGAIPSANKSDIQMIRTYICHGIDEIVSAPQDQNAYKVISNTCASVNCRLTIPSRAELEVKKTSLNGSEFSYKGKDYKIVLCGKFQINNAILVLEIIERLANKGYKLSYEHIFNGLKKTKIPAKFEILSIMPTIIADSTHSEVAITSVCESMSEFQNVIGKKIRLCLPDGPIIDKYTQVLNEQNYEIKKIIVASFDGEKKTNEDYIYCKKVRELIHTVLADLDKDEILLISGPSAFTLKVRYELLAQLGY